MSSTNKGIERNPDSSESSSLTDRTAVVDSDSEHKTLELEETQKQGDAKLLADKLSSSTLYDVKQYSALQPADTVVSTPGFLFLCWLGLRKREELPDIDAIATRESVYDGPHAQHYLPNEDWENRAYFDPSFRWTGREERKALRKTDWKILTWTMLMWFMVNVVRGNLTNATADNFLKDANLTQADYNLGLTLQRVAFMVAELPSQVIGKKLGVDIWLPIQMVCFSALGMAQFWIKGRNSFITLRFCIALFQGGFVPDAILYLSYFYTKSELPVRLALFWSMNSLGGIFTGFTSVGLIEMRGVAGHAGWQWMFLIHGLISMLVGIASFFLLAPSPSQTKSRFRPNGYYTENEVKIVVNKVIRDDPSKATMHNRQALSPGLLWKSLKEYELWPLYLVGLTFGLPSYPLANYFQLSMRQLGFNRIMANLLSVPNAFATIVNLILVTIASELFNNRTWLSSVQNWWFLPFFIALTTVKNPTPWAYFAIATGVLSYPYVHALQAAWCSRNSGSVRTRTVSAAMYNMAVQLSGVIGANVYQASDAPRYYKANYGLLAVIAFNLAILYPSVYLFYKWKNAQREKKWNALTLEQQADYLRTTTDEGCRRLDFRFAY